jgi:hypothetical protein
VSQPRPLAAFAWLTLTFLVLLQAGCAGDADEARVRFAAIGWDARALQQYGLEFAFDDGVQTGVVRGDELVVDDTYAQPHSGWLSTATSGHLRVSAVIRRTDGSEVGRATIELELKPDWTWEVQAHLSDTDPARMCFGCAGSLRVTPPSEGEAVWLAWGGNSIRDPVAH